MYQLKLAKEIYNKLYNINASNTFPVWHLDCSFKFHNLTFEINLLIIIKSVPVVEYFYSSFK